MLRSALVAMLLVTTAGPAVAAGEIIITQAKANAGNVTPGDSAGYPITISRPGSYELGGNLGTPANKNGIVITADDVTIDFNGFRLHGGNKARTGILSTRSGITIRNGTIRAFKSDGIDGSGSFWVVEKMKVLANGKHGVSCDESCMISESVVADNSSFGITCGNACLVRDNIVSGNEFVGISANVGNVQGNIVSGNASPGLQGGRTGFGNNVFFENSFAGTVLKILTNVCGTATTLTDC